MLNKLRHEVENTLKSTLNKISSFQDYLSTYSLVSISFDAHRDHVDNMLKKKKSKKRKVDDDFIKLTGEPQNKNNNKPLVAIVPSISVKPSSTSVEEGEWNKVKSKRRIKTTGKVGTQAGYLSRRPIEGLQTGSVLQARSSGETDDIDRLKHSDQHTRRSRQGVKRRRRRATPWTNSRMRPRDTTKVRPSVGGSVLPE